MKTAEKFNMLDHVDKFTPSKGGKYICPVCFGNDLSISASGAYKCWSNNCDSGKIRDAVAPWSNESQKEYKSRKSAPKSSKTLDNEAISATIAIECKIDELAYKFESGDEISASKELLDIELAAWCKVHGHNAFSAGKLFTKRLKDLAKARREIGIQERAINPDKEPTVTKSYRGGETRLQIDYEMIEGEIGDKLEFDEATQNFYLSGQKFHLEFAKMTLSIDYGLPIKSGKEDVMDICVRLSQKRSFNAVTTYLDKCHETAVPNDLWDLAARLFGTGQCIHQIYLRKWLIGAVARAYKPGCKADNTVILQGMQNQGKSSFFKALVPNEEWFNENGLKGAKISDDEIRTAHRVWLIECPEVDKLFKKACSSELKAFFTLQNDWIRPLYAKMPILLPRHSLMAGTTNEDQFFTDETGNRRYWVIPVLPKKIDVDWLIKNRDSVWAGAVAAYKSGEQWWLTEDEEEIQRSENRTYQREHPWHSAIEFYVNGMKEITSGEIFYDVLKISIDKIGRSEQMQVSGILKVMGFKRTSRRKDFMNQRLPIYEKVAEKP
jgi:predicted P-loop ATPase